MSSALSEIASELSLAKIEYRIIGRHIYVPLPKNFDTLIIEVFDDGDDSITLENGSFHTHGDIEAREYGLPNREKAIRHLVESIFNGKYKMVQRQDHLGQAVNTIWDTFSLASIPDDVEYKII